VKILIPLFALVQLSSANASLVGIMDSGTDISHKDLTSKTWINVKEKAGSTIDLDSDGLPGDINGWDFTENSAKVFNDKYNFLITDDVKTFFNNYSKYELGQLTNSSPELAWLKTHTQDQDLMNKVNFVGEYIHGTHVAGISALNNGSVKILAMKIIPTVYKEYQKVDPAAPKGDTNPPAETTPLKTVDEFIAEVQESAATQITEMVGLHAIINFHKVDVVNQSFGIGYNDAVNFIHAGFVTEVQREPTKDEMDKIVNGYFAVLMQEGPKMFAAAPNTIFAIAAGNDSSNNDLNSDYPADIPAENKIVVAATVGYKSLADFSNYGATRVDVAAPGVAILSTAPTNTYIALSGTSQATPFVTNIVAAMKDVNPALSVRDLKTIVLGTVDVKTWLKGKVKTSGIVNKARALKAAELAKTQTVDLAVSKARTLVADVLVEKSFSHKPSGLAFNFKPIRPSLLIKQLH
jgi:cell wall-associated protease